MVTKTRGGAATRAPSRAAAKKPASRSRKTAPTRSSRAARSSRPSFWHVQSRDLWAVGLITLGVLLMLALWGQQLGPVGHGVNTALALVAGWARVLLPLVAVGAGVALLFDRGARRADLDDDRDDGEPPAGADPWRLAVGTVLGLLGICGLAEVANGTPTLSSSHSLRDAGGYLGALVGRPLHAGLGTTGAAVLLVAVILVAILIATGVSLATVGRGLRSAGVGGAAPRRRCGAASPSSCSRTPPRPTALQIPPRRTRLPSSQRPTSKPTTAWPTPTPNPTRTTTPTSTSRSTPNRSRTWRGRRLLLS